MFQTMTTSIRLLHLIPRIMGILAIIFISLFALDAFEAGIPLGKQIIHFMMHLIPTFILVIILIVAWKWELIGGILFTSIGLVLSPIVFVHNFNMNQSVGMSLGIIAMITLPFIVIGTLFIASHIRKKATPSREST